MSSTSSNAPRIAEGVHSRIIGDEVVIVDEHDQVAHVLQGATARAWIALTEGSTSGDAGLSAGLTELADLGLVRLAGSSRRDFLRQAGTVAVGASAITIGLPSIAAAHSNAPASHAPGSFTLAPEALSLTTLETKNVVATLTQDPDHGIPTGTVSLRNEASPNNIYGSGTIDPETGIASIAVVGATIPPGTYRGLYSGDAVYAPNTTSSNTVTISVTQAQTVTPPTLVGTSTPVTTGNTTTLSLTKPAGVLLNDVLIAHVAVAEIKTVSAAGWTLLKSTNSAATTQAIFVKRADAADVAAASFSFTWSNTARAIGAMWAWRGVSALPTAAETPTGGTGSGTSMSAPTVTVGGAQRYVLTLFSKAAVSAADDKTAPTDFTERYDANHATYVGIGGFSRLYTTDPGSVGPFASTSAASQPWVAHSIVVRGSA